MTRLTQLGLRASKLRREFHRDDAVTRLKCYAIRFKCYAISFKCYTNSFYIPSLQSQTVYHQLINGIYFLELFVKIPIHELASALEEKLAKGQKMLSNNLYIFV